MAIMVSLNRNCTKLVCTALPIAITDASGSCQYGGAKLADFPEGLIIPLGAVLTGTVTLGTTGTITDTWEGICSLGTDAAAAANATLTATEANIIASTAVAAATSKVATLAAATSATLLTESGAAWVDGTTTAADLYLNLIVTDSATHTSGTGTFTGTIYLNWLWCGDK
jgi:hypothetical protein